MLSHYSCDALVIDLAALRLADLRRHPPPAVPASMFVLRVSNLLDQLFVVERALRRRTHARRVESAARDRQQLAHHRRRIGLSMLFDPRVLHIDSLAKYAAAFFRISFSSLSFAFSCRNRLSSASSSDTGCAGARLTNSWPLRARYTQFASDLFDISSERATAATDRPPSITCLTAASRNSGVYLRSGPDFISTPQGQHNRPRGVRFSGASSIWL